MDREISFRGKALQGGEWVFGDYMSYAGGAQIWTHDPDGGTHNVLVDPSTVGQYTGLKDKNGKKIFEGDIVQYGDTIHKVVFESRCGTAYFGLVYGTDETLPFGHYQDLRQIEVIGNVCDNPELLEGGDEA